MKLTLKVRGFIKNGVTTARIEANDESGVTHAAWSCATTEVARNASSYNSHRISKGDFSGQEVDVFTFEGDHENILSEIKKQLPKAFIEAGWVLRENADQSSIIEFLRGLGGGCAWFQKTDAKLIKKIEKAQKALSFEYTAPEVEVEAAVEEEIEVLVDSKIVYEISGNLAFDAFSWDFGRDDFQSGCGTERAFEENIEIAQSVTNKLLASQDVCSVEIKEYELFFDEEGDFSSSKFKQSWEFKGKENVKI